jgi:hypothetical protein
MDELTPEMLAAMGGAEMAPPMGGAEMAAPMVNNLPLPANLMGDMSNIPQQINPEMLAAAMAPAAPVSLPMPSNLVSGAGPMNEVPVMPPQAQASQQFQPGMNIKAVVQSDGTLAIHRTNEDGTLGPVIKVVKLPTA